MIEIKNTRVYGLEEATKRSGYPLRWEEPDDYGYWGLKESGNNSSECKAEWKSNVKLQESDYQRAKNLSLVNTGTGHDNFLKGIVVQFDLKYSLYFTKQLQRYSHIDIISSQSTMHTITKRGSIDDFVNKYVDEEIISILNEYIELYNKEKDSSIKYYYFMCIVSNLPSGYESWMGITTNYLQLKTIYFQRKDHKLKEDWGEFCKWIEELPYFKEWIIKEE